VKDDILKIKGEFSGYFSEREDEINGALLAVLSSEHVLFLGPPGTAKTLLAKKICEVVDDGQFFYYLLTRFTTPEEIFGPLSLKALENDEFKRKVDDCLPTSHIALLDEIFKANSSILNSLLTIINERKFHNGNTVIDVPLISVFGASNELPEEDENLDALYDRFLFRYSTDYLQDEDNFDHLIYDSSYDFKPSCHINIRDINKLQASSLNIKTNDDVKLIIRALRKEMNSREIHISDRRWKKIVNVLKIASATNGDKTVDKTMLTLLQHMLWTDPQQKDELRNIIFALILSGGVNTGKLDDEINDLTTAIFKTNSIRLPTTVTCDNCKTTFDQSSDLIKHEYQHQGHKYSLKNRFNNTTLTGDFTALCSNLKNEHNFSLGISITDEQKKINHKEYQSLVSEFNKCRQQIDKEEERLKKTLDNNIWVSTKDRDELLIKYESHNKSLYNIETKLDSLKAILEKPPESKPQSSASSAPRGILDVIK
jgi:MoxR-like ATPase